MTVYVIIIILSIQTYSGRWMAPFRGCQIIATLIAVCSQLVTDCHHSEIPVGQKSAHCNVLVTVIAGKISKTSAE
jgi:hypothetical protein